MSFQEIPSLFAVYMYPRQHRNAHPHDDEAHMAGLFRCEKRSGLSVSYTIKMEKKPTILLHNGVVHTRVPDPWFRLKKISVQFRIQSLQDPKKWNPVSGEAWYGGQYIESPRNSDIPVLELSNANHMLPHEFWLLQYNFDRTQHLSLIPTSTILNHALFTQQTIQRPPTRPSAHSPTQQTRSPPQQQNGNTTIPLSELRSFLEEISRMGLEDEEEEEQPLEESIQELLQQEARASAAGGTSAPSKKPNTTSMPQHIANGYLEGLFEKKESCPITCEELGKQNTILTPCGHALSRLVGERWIQEKSSCPVCRSQCPSQSLMYWKAV